MKLKTFDKILGNLISVTVIVIFLLIVATGVKLVSQIIKNNEPPVTRYIDIPVEVITEVEKIIEKEVIIEKYNPQFIDLQGIISAMNNTSVIATLTISNDCPPFTKSTVCFYGRGINQPTPSLKEAVDEMILFIKNQERVKEDPLSQF